MKIQILIFSIVLLAGLLRFFSLGSNPPGLNWDEAAWGYNAYSLGTDLKDEFGRLLPYDYLESFGDYKPPMYAYIDILPIKVFGLNEFAIRFPSALLGTFSVFITYLLVKRLFRGSRNAAIYALTSAFFLAISPWHINLSRAAYEANVASFFIITGVWLFVGAMQEKRWYLPLSAVFFALSFYIFNTPRVVVPILILFLVIGFRKQILENKKYALIAGICGFLTILPIINFLLSPQANLRFREVNIFSDVSVIKRINQEVFNDQNAVWSKALHHRYLTFTVEYLKHYFDNFDFNFLFIQGDRNPRFSTQDTGQMYLWDLPFFIIGFIVLFRRKEKEWWIIPVWMIIGIIAAATARETPHALRTETSLPIFQIITAIGFSSIIILLKDKKRKSAQAGIFIIYTLLFLNCFYYLHSYYTHYPQEYASEWQYGYKESVLYVESVKDLYTHVEITNNLGRPYIYYLLYMQVDPQYFRKTAVINRDPFGFVHVNGFGKYQFVDSMTNSKGTAILYIDIPTNVPKGAKILRIFYLPDNVPVLDAYTI